MRTEVFLLLSPQSFPLSPYQFPPSDGGPTAGYDQAKGGEEMAETYPDGRIRHQHRFSCGRPRLEQAGMAVYAPRRIDEGGDAGIGRANQAPSRLHRPEYRHGQAVMRGT